MRKRFVTTLLTGILTLVCALGLTACGNGNTDIPDGETSDGTEVTEEQWKAAFEATLEANNCTVDAEGEFEEISGAHVEFVKANGTMQYNYNEQTCEGCSYTFANSKSKITETDGKTTDTQEYQQVYYSIDKTTRWVARCYEEEEKIGEWEVDKYEYSDAETAKRYLTYEMALREIIDSDSFVEKESKETNGKKLSDLFSAFTYSNGKYSADLDLYYNRGSQVTVEITIVDGYIKGCRMEMKVESDSDEGVRKERRIYTYHFKDYGTTTVPAAPEGAIEAINKAKAEQ